MDASICSDLLSRAGAAVPHACASRMRVNPACVARPAAAASVKPKRPRSCVCDELPISPLPKRCRSGIAEEPLGSPRKALSLAEREAVSDLLLSLVQPGAGDSCDSFSDRVLPLPDSLVSFLQENQTGCGGGDDEIEIDVHDLGDDALYGIKTRITEYKQARQAALSALSSRRQSAAPRDDALSMRELLAKGRSAMEAVRRRDIERRRAEARRAVEQVVRTVEFNDPFIDPQDVLKKRKPRHDHTLQGLGQAIQVLEQALQGLGQAIQVLDQTLRVLDKPHHKRAMSARHIPRRLLQRSRQKRMAVILQELLCMRCELTYLLYEM